MFTAWCFKGIYYVIFVFRNIFCSSLSVVLVFVPPSVLWVLFFLSSVCLLRTLWFSLEGSVQFSRSVLSNPAYSFMLLSICLLSVCQALYYVCRAKIDSLSWAWRVCGLLLENNVCVWTSEVQGTSASECWSVAGPRPAPSTVLGCLSDLMQCCCLRYHLYAKNKFRPKTLSLVLQMCVSIYLIFPLWYLIGLSNLLHQTKFEVFLLLPPPTHYCISLPLPRPFFQWVLPKPWL